MEAALTIVLISIIVASIILILAPDRPLNRTTSKRLISADDIPR